MINTWKGHALVRQYGQKSLSIGITENHQRVKKFKIDGRMLVTEIKKPCGERLFRRRKGERDGFLVDLRTETINTHQIELKRFANSRE